MNIKLKANYLDLNFGIKQALLLLVLIFFVFSPQIKAQPGGDCESSNWYGEPCRSERLAMLQKYKLEITEIDNRISREPRNSDLYYQRGKIFSAMLFENYFDEREIKTGIEFEGKVYFTEIDKKALADFTQAIMLSPKPAYLDERGSIYRAYWELEKNRLRSFFNYEKRTDKEILQSVDKLFFDNVNLKAAETDFLRAIEVSSSFDESEKPREHLSYMKLYRGIEIGNNKAVAKLIGSGSRVDVVLADFDYHINYIILVKKYLGWDFSIQPIWLEKASAAKNFGRDETALKALEEAEKLEEKGFPPTCNIYANRAAIYLKQQKFEAAIQNLNFAVEHNPNCKTLIEVRGDIYHRKGDLPMAIESYSLIINDKNSYTDDRVYWKRGKIYLQTGEIEKAVADFTTAIGNATLCEEDYIIRARAYRLLGNEKAAQSDEKKILETLKNQKNYQPSDNCYYQHQQIEQ